MSQETIYRSEDGQKVIMELYERALQMIPVELEDKMVKTRFGKTHLLITGPKDGQPLVIFHGGNSMNPLSLRDFIPILELNKYRIYAPDTIGHPGKSTQKRVSPSDNSYGEWVVDFLDVLGLDQVMIIGPSYGAGISIRTAAIAPVRISKLVLIVPSGIVKLQMFSLFSKLAIPMVLYRMFPSEERLEKAAGPLFTKRVEKDEMMLEMVKAAYHYVKIESTMPKIATKEELADFNAPVLVIANEKDVLFPGKAVIKRAKEIFPNLVEIKLNHSYGHITPEKGKDEMNNLIIEFLKK